MSKDIGNSTESPQQLSLNSSKSGSKSGSVSVSSIISPGGEGDDQSRSSSCPSSYEPKTSMKPKETSKLNTNATKNKVNKNSAKNNNGNDAKKVTKKYFCSTCGQGFTRKHNMVSHELIHSSMKPHICTVCNSKFRRIHDLKRHEKLHTGEKPYICDRCSRSFARPDALTRHKNSQDACSAVKSETNVTLHNAVGNPIISDESISDSNTPMSASDGSGGNDRRSRDHPRSSTHTYRQPYTTTTTTTTTTTRRYEDSRVGNQNESKSLPPLDGTRDRSRSQTQLPPYSSILGTTQSDQSTASHSWQLPSQQLPHRHPHHHSSNPHHPSPDHSPRHKQRTLPFNNGPSHGDMNYSRSIHHQPLILNNFDRQRQSMEPQSSNSKSNMNQISNQSPNYSNLNSSSSSKSNIMNSNPNSNSSSTTWPSSISGPSTSHSTMMNPTQDSGQINSPGYPYLHEESKNQTQQEEPKNYVTLAKYQDLVNYAQSLQDSVSKMNVRLKLLEGQRDHTDKHQADHHSD